VLKGRDALAVLERACANRIDVPVGKMVYTGMLNARGGFESDLTIVRLAQDEFLFITGSHRRRGLRLDRAPFAATRRRRSST
jgi:4-methylaminobutanoate oxidase (formaldehyde-forming)